MRGRSRDARMIGELMRTWFSFKIRRITPNESRRYHSQSTEKTAFPNQKRKKLLKKYIKQGQWKKNNPRRERVWVWERGREKEKERECVTRLGWIYCKYNFAYRGPLAYFLYLFIRIIATILFFQATRNSLSRFL